MSKEAMSLAESVKQSVLDNDPDHANEDNPVWLLADMVLNGEVGIGIPDVTEQSLRGWIGDFVQSIQDKHGGEATVRIMYTIGMSATMGCSFINGAVPGVPERYAEEYSDFVRGNMKKFPTVLEGVE